MTFFNIFKKKEEKFHCHALIIDFGFMIDVTLLFYDEDWDHKFYINQEIKYKKDHENSRTSVYFGFITLQEANIKIKEIKTKYEIEEYQKEYVKTLQKCHIFENNSKVFRYYLCGKSAKIGDVFINQSYNKYIIEIVNDIPVLRLIDKYSTTKNPIDMKNIEYFSYCEYLGNIFEPKKK